MINLKCSTLKKGKKIRCYVLVILSVLVPILIASYLFVNIIYIKNNETMYNTIYNIGKKQSIIIEDSINGIISDLTLISQDYDPNGEECSKLRFNIEALNEKKGGLYNNIIILDNNLNLLYGFNYNRDDYSNNIYFKGALSGKVGVSEINFNNRSGSFQVAVPIFDTPNSSKVIGVISTKIKTNYLSTLLSYYSILEDGYECYILDENGVFITESIYKPDAVGKERVDLNKLKLNIDYDHMNIYKNHMGKNVFGVYFKLPYNDWTLILEKTSDFNEDIKTKINNLTKILSIVEIIIIFFSQKFFPAILKVKDEVEEILEDKDDKISEDNKDKKQ